MWWCNNTNIQSQPSLLTLCEHKTSFSLQVISSESKQAMRKQLHLYAWGTNAAVGAKGMLSMLRQQTIWTPQADFSHENQPQSPKYAPPKSHFRPLRTITSFSEKRL